MATLRVAVLFLFFLVMPVLQAAETEALFSSATGKLIVPYLRVGNEIYYVEMDLVDPVNLLFKLSLNTAINVTPGAANPAPLKSAIWGTWNDAKFSVTFKDDGTYRFTTTAASGCPVGEESGVYQWEGSTAILIATPLLDANGACGFSAPGGAKRISIDGNVLIYTHNNVSTTLGNTNSGSAAKSTLTVTKSGNGSGSVSSSQQPGINCGITCSGEFASDITATLAAVAANGSYFKEWTGCPDASGPGGSLCNVQMNSSKTVGAKFEANLLTVSTAGNGSGTVTSSPTGINCTGTGPTCTFAFNSNTTASLTALPANGSFFQSWSGGCTSISGNGGNICNVLITPGQSSNVTVTAVFMSSQVSVTTGGTGNGSVTSSPAGINCGASGTACSFAFNSGTTASLTALASNGSSFIGWSGGCTSFAGTNNNICNVLMSPGSSQNITVTALFKLNLLTASTAGTGSGSISSSPAGINCGTSGNACSFSFNTGTTASLTALAATGSTFQGWSGGCTSTTGNNGNICNVLITAESSNNVTVTASFTKNP